MVGRVCLGMLRARTARRQDALNVRLPDPVVTYGDESDPEAGALLANSVQAVRNPADPDADMQATGGLLPGPGARLAGPAFAEWLNSTP